MSYFDYGNDSMLEMYLFESTTLLEQLEDILIDSEKEENLSAESVNEIFRIMHTIKGSSAMMEFDSISHVSHKLEDLFYFVRDKGMDEDYSRELFDLVLRVSDFLKQEVDKIRNSQQLSQGNPLLIEEILDLLERMQNGEGEEAPTADPVPEPEIKEVPAPEPSEKEEPAPTLAEKEVPSPEPAVEAAAGELASLNLHVRFSAGSQMENVRALMLVNKLESAGKVLTTLPADVSNNKDAVRLIPEHGFYCCFESTLPQEEVVKLAKGTLSVETVAIVDRIPEALEDLNPALAPQEPVSVVAPAPGESISPAKVSVDSGTPVSADGDKSTNSSDSYKNKPAKQNLINVDLNKLDNLMDLVGEIVITESMVSGNPDLAGLELENFNRASRQLRKLTDELQDMVMSIRMVPISATFQKMKRIVRDMGKKLDKEVDLHLIGETTEVDKTIIDGIADPLMHLVRNAMDHAIEDKKGRRDAGKSPVGQIVLSAQNVGGDIIISVSDDGKGLDAEMILEKARAKNLLTKPDTEYSEKEIFNLLTLPGFSTKEAVTEFSGRGVGMDVVKKNIEKIGGTVTIESVKGVGTNIYFKIPLTLAIISSMDIRVGKDVFVIPINNIRESFKAGPGQVFQDPDGNEMIMIRGACYPIIRLHKIFQLTDTVTQIEEGILLLVDSGTSLACIFADELLGKHQVVVKPLPIYLSRFDISNSGLAGCTIMGDGSMSLILDIQNILEQR